MQLVVCDYCDDVLSLKKKQNEVQDTGMYCNRCYGLLMMGEIGYFEW